MAKVPLRFFKAGRVLAPDSKWTGEEPEWDGWESWPLEKFFETRSRMLRFYGYYLGQAELHPFVLDWMKENKYSKADIETISSAPVTILPSTVGKLVRAFSKGMPHIHPRAQEYFDSLPFHGDEEDPDRVRPKAKSDKSVVKAEIADALNIIRGSGSTKDTSATPKPKAVKVVNKQSVQDKLRLKVDREVIYYLDEMLDKWIEKSQDTKVETLSLTSFIRDGNIPPAGCKFVLDWINKLLEEYRGAYERTCPDCVEGYSNMSNAAIRNRINHLTNMIAEVEKFSAVTKTRKPREKKTKDASKQVSRLKYQTESEDYPLKSISPTRIPASHRLYVFNTKYRTLGVYHAAGPSGFEVQGTSIKKFDPKTSYVMTLRKPMDVLSVVMSDAPKKVDLELGKIKSTRRKANGRINEQTILLRVVEQKV